MFRQLRCKASIKRSFPEPSAAGGTADGQSAQERGWDQRIARQPLADCARESVEPNTVCGKGVVAENGTAGINQDERRGDPRFRVLASLMGKYSSSSVTLEENAQRSREGPSGSI